jgi:tRNA pseudouridine55 synthase
MTQKNKQQRQPKRRFDGVLVVDKPTDWTSHDVVAKVRNTFRLHKLGHAGTLDPVATGVLVLLSGKATKASQFLVTDEKEYQFEILLGKTTDTQDITGTVLEEKEVPQDLAPERVESILDAFRGEIQQLPPMFSAVKVSGQRLYKLGRKGQEIEREPRPITIHSLTIDSITPPYIRLDVICSKGTYVRTLCHDIGEQLGCGGCMASLQRLRSGRYSIKDAYQLDEILKWTPEEFESHLFPVPSP